MGSGDVDKAAIFNVEGTSVWASSPDFKVRQHSFLHDSGAMAYAFDIRWAGGGTTLEKADVVLSRG